MLDPDEHDVQKALPELDPILSSGSRRTDGRHSGSGEGLKSWDPTPLILACLPAWPWPTTKQKDVVQKLRPSNRLCLVTSRSWMEKLAAAWTTTWVLRVGYDENELEERK
ncbi:hypothetical protein AXG93_2619s1020 [Marchantia polymorpha subsp. ruderalis]|nr:hypothetical protein AXG93_2619s1020 [Marchantia polymorpha subsp. ruderalis]